MSDRSTIEWTDATWNPVRGCTKITSGCANCYAATFAERFRGVAGHPYEQGFDLRLVPEKLTEPFQWRRSRRVFVNSMSDLFHEDIPEGYVADICRVMEHAHWHTYQVLTKRSARMAERLSGSLRSSAVLPHIWWGVSVENRKQGLPRIEDLRHSGASVKFLSIEPLLESLGALNLEGIDWVIVGGESGRRSREVRESWVLEVRDQCLEQGVPFFFKQWGGTRKHAAGRELQGRTYDDFPSSPPQSEVDRATVSSALAQLKAVA